MRSGRCRERERMWNQSVQSVCLLYSPQPSNILLSLSLSLFLYRSLLLHGDLSPWYIPPLHLPGSLSFSVVSHGDTNAEDSKFKQDKYRDKGKGGTRSFKTRQKSKNDLIYWARVRPGAQTAAWVCFSLFSLKSSVHKLCTVLHVRT